MVPKAVRNRVRLAQQRAAAEITTPMPRQKPCRLGGDHASLDADQRRLGFVERQTDHLQPVVALVELQDLALADHPVVVGHDPELDLNTHARPKGCHCRCDYLSTDRAPIHPDLPHFAMLPIGTLVSVAGTRWTIESCFEAAKRLSDRILSFHE